MKKSILYAVMMVLFISCFVMAGKESVTPSALLLNSDKVELVSATFVWGAAPAANVCTVKYKIWNDSRGVLLQTIDYNIANADFTALVSGFGPTLESRLETSIWQDIQNKFDLVTE